MSSLTKSVLAALLLSPALASAADAPKVTFSGLVDSYYTLNLTQGQSLSSPTAGAGAYSSATGFNLNYAKLASTAEAGPATLKLELGAGKQGAIVGDILVQQGYVSMKFGSVTVDAGRFYTPAGFEVFDGNANWLYSKGLLFNFAVPTAHEGVRVALPLSETLTLTGTIANGSDLWANDLGASGSPYKTGIASLGYTKDATFAAVNVLVSKDPVSTEDAFQVDVVASQGYDALSIGLQGDYGTLGSSDFFGAGLWGKFALEGGLELVGRFEYYSDKDGLRLSATDAVDALAEDALSLTVGANYAVGSNAVLKAEVRYDKAGTAIYGADDSLATFTVGALAWF
ncbi:MAG: outer membrane beta-barrel protein [Anaeromyxobacter sp.]|nr:outer membrane beta-barrel protein [Anaeromyxobacter sp.]